jgi:sialate O-acetylesterase
MVLQRGVDLPVWGWAAPGSRVTVTLTGDAATATADRGGAWRVRLAPLPAGGPHALVATAGRETVAFSDILIGDVWLASGQSNMEWPVAWAQDATRELAAADWPEIRLLKVPHQVAAHPRDTLELSGWQVCSPESVKMFSAVAYFFGRDLHAHLHVPIGLIDSSWGGAAMEAWTPLDALRGDPLFESAIQDYEGWAKEWGWLYENGTFEAALNRWREQTGGDGHSDPGRQPFTSDWPSPEFRDEQWRVIETPGPWEENGFPLTDGVLWFRRDVELPSGWAGRDLALRLGAIDDDDTAFFNGVEVGRTGPSPNSWMTQRDYRVPGHLVRPGRAVIAVRVFDGGGPGGLLGPAEAMTLSPAGEESASVPLAGRWRCRPAVALQQDPRVVGANPNQTPSILFNAMIHPLIPFAIRGVIWYQGESNVARHAAHRALSERMIADWRRQWGNGDFPFLLVQLASFDADWPGWPELEWAQMETAREVPNVGLAVAADIGARHDIHPRNKQEVGRRLALVARALAYGEDVEDSGPICRSARRAGRRVVLQFDHAQGGLSVRGAESGEPGGFELAGPDGAWKPAEAEIRGESVTVWSDDVPSPVSLRYNWNDWPTTFLCNRDGLPAPLFRIDDLR